MLKPFKLRPGAFSKTYSSAQLVKNKQNISNLANIQTDVRNSSQHNRNSAHGAIDFRQAYQSEYINQDNYNFPLAVSVQKQRKSLAINKETNASINKKNQKLALKFQQQNMEKQHKQIKRLKDQLRTLQKNQKMFDQKLYQQQMQIQQLTNQNNILNMRIEQLENGCRCDKFSETIKTFIYWIMKLFSQSSKYMQKTRNKYDQTSIQYKYKNFISCQLIEMFKQINEYIDMFSIKDELMRIAQKESSLFKQQKSTKKQKTNQNNAKLHQQTGKMNIKEQIRKAELKMEESNRVNINANNISNMNMNSIFTQEDILQNVVVFAEPNNLLDTFNLNQLQTDNMNKNDNVCNQNQINDEDQEKTNKLFENVTRKLFQSQSQLQTPQLSQYEFHEKQNQQKPNININEGLNKYQNQFIDFPRQKHQQNNLRKRTQNDDNTNFYSDQRYQQSSMNELQLKQLTQMYASQNYNSEKDNHIKVQKGQKIKLLKKVKHGLWIAECGERLGYVPQNILTK